MLCLQMGCSASIAPLQQHEDIDHLGIQILDSRQRRIVQETWRQLQPERVNIGKQVFLNAFENDPRIKTAFKLESAWGDSLLTNADFQTQSTRFVDVLGFVVDNVDCLHTICEQYLLRIGGIHSAMDGFSVEYIDEFEKSFYFVWQKTLKNDFTPEVRVAWQMLFHYIGLKVKQGIDNASKDKCVKPTGNGIADKDKNGVSVNK